VSAVVSRPRGAAPAAAALLTLSAAVTVIAFGVIATSGVYGSRMAWLLGVALPLSATSMLLSWRAVHAPARVRPDGLSAGRADGRRVGRVAFLAAALLVGIPFACTLVLLAVDVLLFALHGLSSLF
jgi:hypothetical protein